MKDDLVEQCTAAAKAIPIMDRTCNLDQADAIEIANAVLAIARPAILEEAAQWHEKNARYCREIAVDAPRLDEKTRDRAKVAAAHHDASAVGLRRLSNPPTLIRAHTTGQEGGR